MTMQRQWVATCDAPDCTAKLTAPTSWDRWDFGLYVNDQNWAAGPRQAETFCPEHRHDPRAVASTHDDGR